LGFQPLAQAQMQLWKNHFGEHGASRRSPLNCINCVEYFRIIWALYLSQVEYIMALYFGSSSVRCWALKPINNVGGPS